MFAVEFFETPLGIVVSRMFLASLTYIPSNWYMPLTYQHSPFLIYRLCASKGRSPFNTSYFIIINFASLRIFVSLSIAGNNDKILGQQEIAKLATMLSTTKSSRIDQEVVFQLLNTEVTL